MKFSPYANKDAIVGVIPEYDNYMGKFARLAQDRDLWKFEHKETKAFREYLINEHKDENIQKLLDVVSESIGKNISADKFIANIYNKWDSVVHAYEKRIESLAKRSEVFVDEDGNRAAICSYTGKDASDCGSAVLKLRPDIHYVIMYAMSSIGVFTSIRSTNGSAIRIAQKYGGNGHPNAAGAKVGHDVILDLYKRVVAK
jgi:oligoribonuclease NrnB/cAMP/cGMP phosphodiesterase (DHH superfamily)